MNLFFAAVLVGCAETLDELTYRGPDVTVEQAPDALRTAITVPTGGYQLRRDGIDADGELLLVRYTLEEPPPDEMVLQAISELRDDIALPAAIRRAHVLVARRIRGAHYITAPRHELAAVIDR